jgi:hypothetical protein
VRILRHGDLRHEAAAVLLGHLPVQGEEEAGERQARKRGDVKPRNTEEAQAAIEAATEAVIAQGGAVHEDALWDATEKALDGASPEVLVLTINGTLTEKYKPRGGWAPVVGNN